MLGTVEIANRIKKLAIEMRTTTSTNDERHEMLQDQIELCDELIAHYADDGR